MLSDIPPHGRVIGTTELTKRLKLRGYKVSQRTVQRNLQDIMAMGLPALVHDGRGERAEPRAISRRGRKGAVALGYWYDAGCRAGDACSTLAAPLRVDTPDGI